MLDSQVWITTISVVVRQVLESEALRQNKLMLVIVGLHLRILDEGHVVQVFTSAM